MKRTISEMTNQSLRGLSIVVFTALSACGSESGDDKGDKPVGDICAVPTGEESLGKVTKFEGTAATVAFPGSAAGEEYVVMPYALGNLATVRGDDDKTKFNFTVEAGSGKVLGIQELRRESFEIKGLTGSTAKPMDDVELEHAKRSIINRFNPYLPQGQGESFWRLVRRVEQSERRSQGFIASGPSLEAVLRAQETAVKNSKKYKARMLGGASFAMNADQCPSGEIFVPGMDSGLDISDAQVVDADDFCIVLVDQPTATTVDEIKTVFADLLKTYKTTVYKNEFAASNGMTFKPAIAIIDFADGAKWSVDKTLYGVFSAATSAEEGRPMLYMPVTLNGLAGAEAKNNWYATLAHELQHAIMDYFRSYATADKVQEIPQLDEGLAHFFEDFYGFGAVGFNTFAGTYLSQWYNEDPALVDGEAGGAKARRGAGQSLWYYLASRKGGIEFTDGKPSGGKGIEFIRAAASNAKLNGPQGLQAAYGCDWTETMGNFYGALAVDGSSFAAIPARFKTQGPVGNVKNLLGATATYGYNFNGSYGKPKDRVWDTDRNLTELPRTIEDVPYYAPAPFIYKIIDPAATLKITISDASENAAVSVVRIK